jgi:hypothetical protein
MEFFMTKTIGYFQVDSEGFSIMVVEKTFWNENQCLSDSGLGVIDDLLPEGFYELSDSIFEYDGDIDEARTKLVAIGLEEKVLFEE